MRRNTPEMFWELVTKSDYCWDYHGPTYGDRQYRYFRYQGKNWLAHRLSWVFAGNSIPDDLFLRQLCGNKDCVRPDHLYITKNPEGDTRLCARCHVVKAKSEFPSDASQRDHLSCICRPCNTVKCRELRRKAEYNLSSAEYDAIAAAQSFRCVICKRDHRKLVVDHCHKTGTVRGLLCGQCNSALGMIREQESTALGLVEYIRSRCDST